MLWPYYRDTGKQVVSIQHNNYLGSRQSSQRYFKDPETPYTGEVALTSVEVETTKQDSLSQPEKQDLAVNEYLPVLEHSETNKEATSKEGTSAPDLVDLPEDLYEDLDLDDGTHDRRVCLNITTSRSQLERPASEHAGSQSRNSVTNEVLYTNTTPQSDDPAGSDEEGYVINQLVYRDLAATRDQEDEGGDMYEELS